jgi:hypothetical protein
MTESVKLIKKLIELENTIFNLRIRHNLSTADLLCICELESEIPAIKRKIRKLKENKKRIGVDI